MCNTKNLLQNLQLCRGSCLNKNPSGDELALVTWKFGRACFGYLEVCHFPFFSCLQHKVFFWWNYKYILCKYNTDTHMYVDSIYFVCLFAACLWCLGMVKTIAFLYLAFYLWLMVWLTFFLYVILSHLRVCF